jgi:hypothetical protein
LFRLRFDEYSGVEYAKHSIFRAVETNEQLIVQKPRQQWVQKDKIEEVNEQNMARGVI